MNPDHRTESSSLDAAVNALVQRMPQNDVPSSLIERTLVAMNEAGKNDSVKHRHRRRTWIMATSGIAAALVVGASIVFVSLPPKHASAAESFAEVVKVNEAYRGWVHITRVLDGDRARAWHQSLISTFHLNTIDGTRIFDSIAENGSRRVTFQRPATREEMIYDDAIRQILVGSLTDEDLVDFKSSFNEERLTLEQIIASYDLPGVSKGIVVSEEKDGTWTRFEIKRDPPRENDDNGVIIWVDPDTKLVRQTSHEASPIRSITQYSYGGPDLNDIYDVSVPRDTHITNNRVKPEVDALFKRIESRARSGIGAYVALETSYKVDEFENAQSQGSVTLRSQSNMGELLANTYNVGEQWHKALLPGVELQGWPKPGLMDSLNTLKSARPSSFQIITQDDVCWSGSWFAVPDNPKYSSSKLPKDNPNRRTLVESASLPATIWPVRSQQGFNGAATSISIEKIPDKPEQLAIVIQTRMWQAGYAPMTKPGERSKALTLIVSRFVIDPSRDDMAVSSDIAFYVEGEKDPYQHWQTEYLEYAKLPSGHWYPTRWKSIYDTRDPMVQPSGRTEKMHLLQIFPNESLDSSWFRNYADDPAPTTRPEN